MEKVVSLAKRRGFVFPGSEIYGGFQGFWDYGPLGVELKNNIKRIWWKDTVYANDDIVGIDAAIIMNPEVWEVSGHTESFTDPLVECKKCHKRFRADHLSKVRKEFDKHTTSNGVGMVAPKKEFTNLACSEGGNHEFTEPKTFNLMTEVFIGVTEPKQKAYLRGEITQGAFVNFQNILDSTRIKMPFGIAQIGKAFRNEITPGNFTFRSREFEQMELEYFINPNEKLANETFETWKQKRLGWYTQLGINKNKLRLVPHSKDELAHYAKAAEDIQYEAPFGWSEFEGIHNRADFDLANHKLAYKDSETGESYTPWVIETSGGVDRTTLFFLIDAYHEDGKRKILKLDPRLAPFKAAVFPLLANKPELVAKAKETYDSVKDKFNVAWDSRGNIGKRYFAQDEIGTPVCITFDFKSLEDNTVTLRDRDTAKQRRVPVDKILENIKY